MQGNLVEKHASTFKGSIIALLHGRCLACFRCKFNSVGTSTDEQYLLYSGFQTFSPKKGTFFSPSPVLCSDHHYLHSNVTVIYNFMHFYFCLHVYILLVSI